MITNLLEKYVILQDSEVRVFPRKNIHAFNSCSCPEKDCPKRAVSAGFWDGERAYGESTTLGVKSRPEDTELILSSLSKLKEEVVVEEV